MHVAQPLTREAFVRFIRANTRVCDVPGLPLRLWLADKLTPLWEATERDLAAAGVPPPFWAFAWAGGQAVARYLIENPSLVRGRSVLDLAAGSGLVGIAAALAGAGQVFVNDIDPVCAAAAELNAELNGVELEWLGADLLDGPPPRADLVIAGDVFYEQEMARRFLAFLRQCREAGATVLAGDPGRTYFPQDAFEAIASYKIDPVREIESADVTSTRIWRLR